MSLAFLRRHSLLVGRLTNCYLANRRNINYASVMAARGLALVRGVGFATAQRRARNVDRGWLGYERWAGSTTGQGEEGGGGAGRVGGSGREERGPIRVTPQSSPSQSNHEASNTHVFIELHVHPCTLVCACART